MWSPAKVPTEQQFKMNTKTETSQLATAEMGQYIESMKNDGEIDLTELFSVIWQGKWLICAITSLFAVASVALALYLPNIYKSEALLEPAAQEQDALGGLASQFGGLASLAGINLGGGGSVDKTMLAMEIMKSHAFTTKFIDKHQLLVELMAAKGWDPVSNTLVIDEDIYDVNSKTWVRKAVAPFTVIPSDQEAYIEFQKAITVSQDKTTAMVSISVEHFSPHVAKQWVDWLVEAINLEMKTRDLAEAQKSIGYLEKQLETTKLSELQNVLYQIIEEQTKTIMFAEIREQYAFKTIDPALVPQLKAKPKRAIICILGVLFGGMLAVMIVFIRYMSTKKKP